jgi:hypothetical protein
MIYILNVWLKTCQNNFYSEPSEYYVYDFSVTQPQVHVTRALTLRLFGPVRCDDSSEKTTERFNNGSISLPVPVWWWPVEDLTKLTHPWLCYSNFVACPPNNTYMACETIRDLRLIELAGTNYTNLYLGSPWLGFVFPVQLCGVLPHFEMLINQVLLQ